MKIVITMLFGLESTVKEDLYELGFLPGEVTITDGRIDLEVDKEQMPLALARLNMNLRTAERVLLKFGGGHAETFDDLFDLASQIHWENYIPDGWAFHVNGHSLKSKLFGISSCQAIVKKAIAARLLNAKGLKENSKVPEDQQKGLIKIVFSIVKDEVSFMADTSGEGLHKRGYRPLTHMAPLKETLAAGLVMLSGWRPDKGEALLDPMCGTGTIAIEAAMIAANIAPGLNRGFAAENWPGSYKTAFKTARQEAMDARADYDKRYDKMIFGSDLDPAAISSAVKNAQKAGVASMIRFSVRNALEYDPETIKLATGHSQTLIITNPPYGERLMSAEDAAELFMRIGKNWLDSGRIYRGLRLSVMAPRDSFENYFGGIADRRRKLYNGKIQCNMYHYFKNRRD